VTAAWLHRHLDSVVAAGVLAVVGTAVVLAPVLSPYDPAGQSGATLAPPSAAHWLGTDALGRDTLSRLLHGGGPILAAALTAVAAAALVGTGIGVVAALRGGLVELTLMRIVDVLLAFPSILLAILVVAALGRGLSQLAVALAIAQTPAFARVARATALVLTNGEFVMAARALGASSRRVLGRHVLVNLIGLVVVQSALTAALVIGYVGALSYIGLGVQPPRADWGTMISDASNYIFESPYLAVFPGLAIALVVLSLNFLADGLRDLLDPQRG